MTVTVATGCPECKEPGEVEMTDDEWHWYLSTGQFPAEWPAGKREQAMTGIHPRCWDKMMEDTE
jgi:hypothetical protein